MPGGLRDLEGGMSYWDLRQAFESQFPWWMPIVGPIVLYGIFWFIMFLLEDG